jgi:glycosyltransferase involved in cell wall biosynthesis
MSQPTNKPHLLILEECLRTYHGHWYEWLKAVQQINRERGVRVSLYGHRQMRPEIAQEMDATPWFAVTPFDGSYYSSSKLARWVAVFQHNRRFLQRAGEALEQSGSVDCVFLPTLRIHHLIGLHQLIQSKLGQRVQRWVIMINHGDANYAPQSSEPKFPKTSLLLKQVLKRYKNWVKTGRVCFCSDSDQTAKEFFILSGIPFEEFPTPRTANDLVLTRATPGESLPAPTCTFTCLGAARWEKGSDILQTAIQQFLNDNPQAPVNFVYQWPSPFTDRLGRTCTVDPELAAHPKVTVLTESLTSEAYQRHFDQADAFVLPYRREVYFNRISGVVVEAATAAIPMIVTRDTWLERACMRYGHALSVPNASPELLASAFKDFLNNQAQHKARASERANIARRHHSPQAFYNALWGLPEPGAEPA